eukprot:617748-Pleurochrysis_carterae.AAC.1
MGVRACPCEWAQENKFDDFVSYLRCTGKQYCKELVEKDRTVEEGGKSGCPPVPCRLAIRALSGHALGLLPAPPSPLSHPLRVSAKRASYAHIARTIFHNGHPVRALIAFPLLRPHLVRELGAGRVLAGQQRAPMDCLTLCEEIRVLLPRSQLRRKPLTR